MVSLSACDFSFLGNFTLEITISYHGEYYFDLIFHSIIHYKYN